MPVNHIPFSFSEVLHFVAFEPYYPFFRPYNTTHCTVDVAFRLHFPNKPITAPFSFARSSLFPNLNTVSSNRVAWMLSCHQAFPVVICALPITIDHLCLESGTLCLSHSSISRLFLSEKSLQETGATTFISDLVGKQNRHFANTNEINISRIENIPPICARIWKLV